MTTLIPQFILGLFVGMFLSGLFFASDRTQQIVETLQTLALLIATIFTAYWTSKTFAHQAQTNEAKELMSRVDSLISAISDLSYVSVLQHVKRTMGTDSEADPANFNDEQIYKLKATFRSARDTFEGSFSTTMYLSPEVRAAVLLTSIKIKDEDQLSISPDERQVIIRELLQVKNKISKSAYFNLTLEYRRLRKFLRL